MPVGETEGAGTGGIGLPTESIDTDNVTNTDNTNNNNNDYNYNNVNEQQHDTINPHKKSLGIRMHAVPQIEIAEITKIAENAHRYLQIAFAEDSVSLLSSK